MNTLENTVIKNGFCIGCGICATKEKSAYQMNFDNYGMYVAHKIPNSFDLNEINESCPFSSQTNEDDIADLVFDSQNNKRNEHIGVYQNLYAGFVNDNEYRLTSSSGGLVSWMLETLLSNKLVDAVIHVKQTENKTALFEYTISNTIEEIREGKKSRYYPVEMSKVLDKIRGDSKRYAVVGLPCFIKGLRLLKLKDKQYSNILFCIGINCGQLKSKYFSNLFAAQSKVSSSSLQGIDFRVKLPDTNASEYAVGLEYLNNKKLEALTTKPAKYLFGTDWGMGMLKYKACDVCDDVFNETADIVFGDAWVKPYRDDWKGTNLIISRNAELSTFLTIAIKKREITLFELSESDVIFTQLPSIRHRRETLGYRLDYFLKNLDWVPSKRIKPSNTLDHKTRKIQNLRMKIREKSHIAMQFSLKYNSFLVFLSIMLPYTIAYNYHRQGLRSLISISVRQFIRKII